MLTKTQYKLLIQSYMDRYDCSYTSALQIMSKEALLIYQEEHNVPYEIAALKYDIINNYNLSML